MVVALGPGRFYASSLPRPRFYTDVKLNSERVDPPPSVTDPLLSWANEAHWSMGGLSLNRHHLQGRIEGSIKRLRARQRRAKRTKASPSLVAKKAKVSGHKPQNMASMGSDSSTEHVEVQEKRVEVEEVVVAQNGGGERKKRVRSLGEEFDKIAAERKERGRVAVASRTRRRRSVVVEDDDEGESVEVKEREGEAENGGTPRRSSPRLKK